MSPETRRRWSHHFHRVHRRLPPTLRKVLVTVVGGALLLVGVAMILLPGPAFLMIPAGLAVLSLEYHWAHRLMTRARSLARRLRRPPPRDQDPGLQRLTRRGFGVP